MVDRLKIEYDVNRQENHRRLLKTKKFITGKKVCYSVLVILLKKKT